MNEVQNNRCEWVFDYAWNYHLNWKLLAHTMTISRDDASIPLHTEINLLEMMRFNRFFPSAIEYECLLFCLSVCLFVPFISQWWWWWSSSCAQIAIYPWRWFGCFDTFSIEMYCLRAWVHVALLPHHSVSMYCEQIGNLFGKLSYHREDRVTKREQAKEFETTEHSVKTEHNDDKKYWWHGGHQVSYSWDGWRNRMFSSITLS